jgi:hypothetical protein
VRSSKTRQGMTNLLNMLWLIPFAFVGMFMINWLSGGQVNTEEMMKIGGIVVGAVIIIVLGTALVGSMVI